MYITKDDFLKYTGIDLEIEFNYDNFDNDNAVNFFIDRIEKTTISILKDRYENDNYNDIIKNNVKEFKEALMDQIYYILKNGELWNNPDSDPNKYISLTAFYKFRNLGMCNIRGFS